MTRFVALLRGINVGGRTLKMADLRAVVEAAGGTDVATYIQSGNVVLSHPMRSPDRLAAHLAGAIEDATGMAVPVMARTATEWDAVVATNPFPDAGGTTLHVVFLDQSPDPDAFGDLDLGSFAPEECAVVGRELYLHLPNGMGRSALATELAKRRRPMAVGTSRNWNTVLTLQDLVRASSG